jgi:hypothetical protein
MSLKIYPPEAAPTVKAVTFPTDIREVCLFASILASENPDRDMQWELAKALPPSAFQNGFFAAVWRELQEGADAADAASIEMRVGAEPGRVEKSLEAWRKNRERHPFAHCLEFVDDRRRKAAPTETASAAPVEKSATGVGEGEPPPASYTQPFTIWGPRQFLEFTPDPSANLLGDGFIERGEWTSLVGVGGLGKSRLALWLCVCQITGRDWCGLPTAGEPQRALFLSTENGCTRWKTDLEHMFSGLTDDEKVSVEANLRILALTPDEDGDLNLGNPTSVLRLISTLKAEHPGLVILDPFADMVAGDENKTTDIVETLRSLRTVHRTGAPEAAFLIIHHARTGAGNIAQAGDNFNAGNFGRGSKALYSRVRCELQLAPGDRDDPNRIVLACGKANNSEKFKPRCMVFDPESFGYNPDESFNPDEWRADVAGKRRNQTASIADIVAAVRESCRVAGDTIKTGAIIATVVDATGASPRTIKSRIGEAVKAGYLRKGDGLGLYQLGAKPLKS